VKTINQRHFNPLWIETVWFGKVASLCRLEWKAAHCIGTILKELVLPYKILLLTLRSGQYSSYFSIITDSDSASLSRLEHFPFIIFCYLVARNCIFFILFLFTYLFLSSSYFGFFSAYQVQWHSSFIIFSSLHLRFYLLLIHIYSVFLLYFSSQDRECHPLLWILRSNLLPSKMHCQLRMKRGNNIKRYRMMWVLIRLRNVTIVG
jgi:hypothetical protein